jgi:hypothetical protein
MDTVRVDVTYRPLRVGWAVHSTDIDAIRKAARLNCTLWGGRFNPLLPVDQPAHARRLVDAFRVDMILPIAESGDTTAFVAGFPNLINPFHGEGLFTGGPPWETKANVLDVHNQFSHAFQQREDRALRRAGTRLYSWRDDDPLRDLFLLHLGQYPTNEEIGVDYGSLLRNAARPKEIDLDPVAPLSPSLFSRPSIAYFSRHALERHHSVSSGGWDLPGFFLGNIGDPQDLLTYWNVGAADVPLLFVDATHIERYARLLPAWEKRMRILVDQRRHEFSRHVAVWSRDDDTQRVVGRFAGMQLSHCRVSDHLWNGLNLRPPTMYFSTASTLGIVSRDRNHPHVSFALTSKPFADDIWFHTQHLVGSISFIGAPLREDDHHTLTPPYVPELNEFVARSMSTYDRVRTEPGDSIGVIIDAADTDVSLGAVPVGELFDRVFGLAGYGAKPSSGGLLTRQIIAMLDGLQGGRAFKIPGVRRLLRTFGPNAHFTKKTALQLIGGKDPDNPTARFTDHEDLFVEQRPIREKLTPDAVFAYLVTKGVFRLGRHLTCSHCNLGSWTPIEQLTQQVRCDLCGNTYDASRQLMAAEWDYRRSGLLGAEKNAQGAIPVILTLQQLDTNLSGLRDTIHSISLDLTRVTETAPAFEVDFVWMIPRTYPKRTAIVIGECKDRGPIRVHEFERDVNNLRQIADALPRERFDVFIILSKLSAFTAQEIALARRLNDEYRLRAILLTDRELEPYHVYERTKTEFNLERVYASTPEAMAEVTQRIYFSEATAAAPADPGTT